MPRKPGQLRILASTMPTLQHHWPGSKYDPTKSEVVKWCIKQPEALNAMFNALKNTGGIVFDPETHKWMGVPLSAKSKKPARKFYMGMAEFLNEKEWVPCRIIEDLGGDEYICVIKVEGKDVEKCVHAGELRPDPTQYEELMEGTKLEQQISPGVWVPAVVWGKAKKPGSYICQRMDGDCPATCAVEPINYRRPRQKEEVELE